MPKKKILIIDDQPEILELVGYNLQKEGYDVVKAENEHVHISIFQKMPKKLLIA